MLKTFHTPSGGTYQREVKERAPRRKRAEIGLIAAGKREARVTARAGRTGVQHKAYSYTNKKGSVVHVAAHTEYPKGARPKHKETKTFRTPSGGTYTREVMVRG